MMFQHHHHRLDSSSTAAAAATTVQESESSSSSRRFLYDTDFLDQDCPRDLYNEDSETDDLLWTWMTNYWIAGSALLVALVLSLLLWRMQRIRQKQHEDSDDGNLEDQRERIMNVSAPNNKNDSTINKNNKNNKNNKQDLQQQHQHDDEQQEQEQKSAVSPALPSNLPVQYYVLLIGYFVLVSAGYGIAGVGHQVISNQKDDSVDVFEYAVLILMSAASCTWIAVAVQEYHYAIKCRDNEPLSFAIQCTGSVVALLITAAVTVVSALLLESIILLGVLVFLSVGTICVMSVWQYKRWRHSLFLVDFGAMFLYLCALVLQVFLAPTCGDDGYKECFKDCPLPNPDVYNHNALFHTIVFVSVSLYGISKVIMLLKTTALPMAAKNTPHKKRTDEEPSQVL